MGNCAEVVIDPLPAVSVTVPLDAPVAAVKFRVEVPPGNALNVELGVVTPAGRLVIVPLTRPLNPLLALTETVTACCTPGISDKLLGLSEREMVVTIS